MLPRAVIRVSHFRTIPFSGPHSLVPRRAVYVPNTTNAGRFSGERRQIPSVLRSLEEIVLGQALGHSGAIAIRLVQCSRPNTNTNTNGDAMARDLRRQALQRLAALATTSSITSFDKSDLDRLCRATPSRHVPASAANGHHASLSRPEVGRVPMVANPDSPYLQCRALQVS